ncbi:hypothetical protein TCAL_17057 [Tigriopus californicus]|uniref:Uncharacterized protein n=1 Tax=Tigriopus californicus TaxID=6832 RepID=A0A553PQ47_TIGCA|nr:hypothetical protein TCAL_17057 [Tigriopus californicus]
MSEYGSWTVGKLRNELRLRGSRVTGPKNSLVDSQHFIEEDFRTETVFQKRFENAVSRHNEKTQTFFKTQNIECFEEIQDNLAGEMATLVKLMLGKVVRVHEGTPEI